MHLQHPTFDSVVAYVSGYDDAVSGGLLLGFREWLIVRVDGGHNLGWPQLVSRVLDKTGPEAARGATEQEHPDAKAKRLLDLLEEFLDERGRRNGTRELFLRYDLWLRKQSWYGPGFSEWRPRDYDEK